VLSRSFASRTNGSRRRRRPSRTSVEDNDRQKPKGRRGTDAKEEDDDGGFVAFDDGESTESLSSRSSGRVSQHLNNFARPRPAPISVVSNSENSSATTRETSTRGNRDDDHDDGEENNGGRRVVKDSRLRRTPEKDTLIEGTEGNVKTSSKVAISKFASKHKTMPLAWSNSRDPSK